MRPNNKLIRFDHYLARVYPPEGYPPGVYPPEGYTLGLYWDLREGVAAKGVGQMSLSWGGTPFFKTRWTTEFLKKL